jgi:acetyl esterase
VSVKEAVERAVLRRLTSLPEAAQRPIAGRRVEIDGQRLATDVQLALTLKRLAREPSAESLPMEQGRAVIRRDTALAGGSQPIGSVRDLEVAGLGARLYTPSAPIDGALLVFFHGGGFMHGDLETHDAGCRFLSQTSGTAVLAIDYRLGPEHRFPAAHDDALAAYEWAVTHAEELGADPDRIGVGGDSAGGNLSIWVANEAARRGWPCRVQLLIYPGTDARRETRSARLFAEGFYLTRDYMDLANASYAASDADLDDRRFSPLRDEIPRGVAPALVFTAGFDPLRDEGEEYADRLEAAGADVRLTRFPDQIHGFFNTVGIGTTAPRANRRVALALRMAMTGPTTD